MPTTSPTRASTTTINPCPAGGEASKPARFSRLSPARALSLLTGGPRPPFLATAATRARNARRAPRPAPRPTFPDARVSSTFERARVPRALHVGRAPGPGGPSPRYPRAPFHRSPGRHPPRPAARLWSTKKTPAASLAPRAPHASPRATPASRPHPSQHLTSERLPPPSRVSRAGKKENLPRKAPSHSVDQSVPSVGGAVGRRTLRVVSESAPSFPSRSTPRRSTSSSPLPSSPLDSGRRRRRARWRRSGRSPPPSRKSLDRDRRGASRLAVTVPDLLGAGVSGVSGVSAVSGLTQMDVPSPTVTRGGDSGSPSARQSRGAPTAATAPSPRSRLARTKSRSEATDLASAVGTRTAPVKKRRPPRLLLVSDNAAPLEDAGTPLLAIGGEGNGRALGGCPGLRSARGREGNDAAETRDGEVGRRDAGVARAHPARERSHHRSPPVHHHAPLARRREGEGEQTTTTTGDERRRNRVSSTVAHLLDDDPCTIPTL